jgi:hypothetical protein
MLEEAYFRSTVLGNAVKGTTFPGFSSKILTFFDVTLSFLLNVSRIYGYLSLSECFDVRK